MSEPAILSDLLQVLKFELQEHDTLFDRKTARIVTVSHEVMKALEEDDEDALSSIPDWQRDPMAIIECRAGLDFSAWISAAIAAP